MLVMRLAFQTAPRAKVYRFLSDLCSSLCAELQQTCLFAEYIISKFHRITPMLET